LIGFTRRFPPLLLVLLLGCTLGEAPPEGPVPLPGAEAPREVAEERPVEVEAGAAAAQAAEVARRAEEAYEGASLEEALALSRQVLDTWSWAPAAGAARWVAARSAYGLGLHDEARRLAQAHAERQARGSEAEAEARSLAALAADAGERGTGAALVVGAILPRSGTRVLVQYADWILEGIELAVAEASRRQGRPVELVVADDGGGTRTAAAVAELERRGALAIIGPVLPQQLAEAAAARRDQRLAMVSPTIPESLVQWAHSYSVAGGDIRGAQELGRYAAQAGIPRAAVLHAWGGDYERKARAFAAEFEARGGRIVHTIPYDSGTTTFASHMRRILSAVAADGGSTVGRPGSFALFVSAPDRDVPQIAPQIAYYGLDAAGVQVLGDEAWAAAPVRRVVPDRDLEGVIVASQLAPHRANAVADPDFISLYEARYRRSLPNALPAFGYDAATMVVESLPNRLLTADATSRRLELLTDLQGATGTLSVRGSRVIRTPHLAVIRQGALEPAPATGAYIPPPTPPAATTDPAGQEPEQ
jgi:ABC-type branched-subunit amino acid transport system substrate-binding protein